MAPRANPDQPDDSDLADYYQAENPAAIDLDDSAGDIGARIAEAREAAGMTRAELGESLGVRPATVTRWEQGRSLPRSNRMATVAGLLGVSLSWLLMGRGETAPESADVDTIAKDLLAVRETLRVALAELDRIALQVDSLER